MEISIVVGTRPEIIKMASIIREMKSQSVPFTFIHTGQHHDYDMSLGFIKELGLPNPDDSFRLKSNKPASQIGEMMSKLEAVLGNRRGKLLCIQGDTNTMLAAALSGLKIGMKVCHVEAGLRSYDWRMPEEHNRRMVDHVSDILFAPTKTAERNLVRELVHGKVHVTGNTVIDAVTEYMPIAEKRSNIMQSIPFREFSLVTVHRAENVDDINTLRGIVRTLTGFPIPVVFPVHPRTDKRLRESHLLERLKKSENVKLIHPLGYLDFLVLMKNSKVILTDSGGLQEEATAPCIRKPVVILRLSTERPEAVRSGFARVAGVRKDNILRVLNQSLTQVRNLPWHSPFGDGKAGERITGILKRLS
jgi:UDP-N-acetylglucosamine 2-epimerase (non-hydrolysing)